MSYDMAVWVGAKPSDDAAALKEYEELWEKYEDTEESAHPEILAFIDDLTKRYPDLTELDDDHVDDSPWADGPLTGNVMGPFFYFAMTYSGAEEAVPFVAETAARHGLVCFDPQTTKLI
jgi:hypothetical protein